MLDKRHKKSNRFKLICTVATYSSVVILGVLLFHIAKEGAAWLDWQFLTSFPSRKVAQAGIKSALVGSMWIISLTAFMVVPFGIASAVFMEEYAPKNKFFHWVQINISNLAGMPSIVYGLIGLAVFVRYFALDQSIWAGSLTLTLLILPVIIIASQESIRAVPRDLRMAGYALGARKWQVILGQVLPSAIPGIMTGVILALSRAMGETAPLLIVGALSYVAFLPEGAHDAFTVLPVQIYNWAARPQEEFHQLAAAGIIVLLVLLFSLNAVAVYIRQRFQRYK